MSDRLKLTPGESVIVRRSEPAVLEVEGIWSPHGSPPPKHFHPRQEELFRVISGVLTARVDGVERELRQDDTLEIPPGAVHQMWNAGEVEARASWKTRPAGRTQQWFEAVDALQREREKPGPLDFAPLLAEYDDVFRLAAGPQLLLRPLVRVAGVLGRRRGRTPGR